MAYHSFEELDVWKRACRLAVRVYELFADSREFGLKDQMTRSAVSIASNIAEGAERESTAEFIRFLSYAKGSAAELRTQAYIAQRSRMLDGQESQRLILELKEVSSMLYALAKALKCKE